MADELKVSMSLGGTLSTNTKIPATGYHASVTVTGDAMVKSVQEVGTSEETLAIGDCATVGYMIVKNLDATNYVELGVSTGVYHVKLLAGESALIRWNDASAIYALANTAACDVEYIAVEV